jgi:hypothetical protein
VGSSTQRPQRLFRVLPARPRLKTDLCYAEVVVVPPQVPVARIIVGGAAASRTMQGCLGAGQGGFRRPGGINPGPIQVAQFVALLRLRHG